MLKSKKYIPPRVRTSPAGPESWAAAPCPWRPLSVLTDPDGPAITAPFGPTPTLPEAT